MPIYEFKCESCNQIDEVLMKISDPHPEKCIACGGKVHKIMSQTTFSLKGNGWYVTDYKNSTPPQETKSTTKPEEVNMPATTKPEETSKPAQTEKC